MEDTAAISCLLVLFNLWCTILSQSPGPLVTLNDASKVRGQFVTAKNGKRVTEFIGIPFAEPPIGDLRFRRPVAKKPWRHVINATSLPRTCVQTSSEAFDKHFHGEQMWNPNTELSEDCLYLNVWVPNVLDPTHRLAVMVWIFGGGFWSGTSTLEVYDGKILASEENVIVVSMNYRVSIFGFLYLGREDAPGNAGLWDQLLALKWVKNNIQFFGGNPKAVTIFGESAGAASVSMHVISSRSHDYLQRAIMQSSSASAPWATKDPETSLERALLFSEACKCNVTIRDKDPKDYDKMMKCLRSLPSETLRKNEWITFDFCDFPWTPVVDGDFFTEHPKISLERGHFKNSQILVGTNFDESMYFIIYHHPHIYKVEEFFSKEDWVISDKLFELSAVHPRYGLLPKKLRKNPVVKKAILFEYTDWSLPGSAAKRQQGLDKMLGDYHFTCSVNEFAQHYTEHGGSVYYYYFTHRSSTQTWPEWMGVLHGYEINFVFGEPLNPNYKYTKAEQELSRRFMKYWANFARTG